MNFPGKIAYPLLYPVLTNQTAIRDVVAVTKGREVSLPRGGTAADFNDRLRGTARRIDRIPDLPYP